MALPELPVVLLHTPPFHEVFLFVALVVYLAVYGNA